MILSKKVPFSESPDGNSPVRLPRNFGMGPVQGIRHPRDLQSTHFFDKNPLFCSIRARIYVQLRRGEVGYFPKDPKKIQIWFFWRKRFCERRGQISPELAEQLRERNEHFCHRGEEKIVFFLDPFSRRRPNFFFAWSKFFFFAWSKFDLGSNLKMMRTFFDKWKCFAWRNKCQMIQNCFFPKKTIFFSRITNQDVVFPSFFCTKRGFLIRLGRFFSDFWSAGMVIQIWRRFDPEF